MHFVGLFLSSLDRQCFLLLCYLYSLLACVIVNIPHCAVIPICNTSDGMWYFQNVHSPCAHLTICKSQNKDRYKDVCTVLIYKFIHLFIFFLSFIPSYVFSLLSSFLPSFLHSFHGLPSPSLISLLQFLVWASENAVKKATYLIKTHLHDNHYQFYPKHISVSSFTQAITCSDLRIDYSITVRMLRKKHSYEMPCGNICKSISYQ